MDFIFTANRIPACKLPTDSEVNKEQRGFCLEYMTSINGVDVNTMLWKDNKCVRLASMGRYHIRTKTLNIMIRLFYHFVDMASTNAFFLYKRVHAQKTNDSNNVSDEELLLQLPGFREEIAAGLVSFKNKRHVGRPSFTQDLDEPI